MHRTNWNEMRTLNPEEQHQVFKQAEARAAKDLRRMIDAEERNRRASRLMLGGSEVTYC